MKSLKNYKSRGEKAALYADNWRSKPEDNDDDITVYIRQSFNKVVGADLVSIEDGILLYTDIRYRRHSIWCRYLTNSAYSKDMVIEDTNVGIYSEYLKNKYGKAMLPCPDEIRRLTPDILFYNGAYDVIYVGDVAVTLSVTMSIQTKKAKYLKVKKYFQDCGITVRDIYFIVDEGLSNINECVADAQKSGLINNVVGELQMSTRDHTMCNTIMSSIKTKVPNYLDFQHALDKHDRYKPDNSKIIDLMPEIANTEMPLYTPTMSEDEVIEMIKAEVDSIDHNQYFTNDIGKSMSEIESIYEKNKTAAHMAPKSTLKVICNSHDFEDNNDYNLMMDYVKDMVNDCNADSVKDYILYLMPNMGQINKMSSISRNNWSPKTIKEDRSCRDCKVHGKYQYDLNSGIQKNHLIANVEYQLTKGKRNKNVKTEPEQINLEHSDLYFADIEKSIFYYGSESLKPAPLPPTWEAKTKLEHDNSEVMRSVYNAVVKTNGAQLCSSLSHVYDRLIHLSTNLSKKVNIIVPPNSSFIAIIPPNHAPVNSKSADIPMIFITRYKLNKDKGMDYSGHFEAEHIYDSQNYRYYVSKLARIDLNKMSNWSSSLYKLCASSSYLINKNKDLESVKERVVGVLTYFIVDTHQKTSEFLDLFKYVSFMPFSDISRLPELIADKFNILLKTKLDAWMLKSLKNFILELSNKELLKAHKPKIRICNAKLSTESLGISMRLPSFISNVVRYDTPSDFIEEISVLYTVRPKHLYGSQFIDKSTTDTVKWNIEYNEEISKWGTWLTTGERDVTQTTFPFDSKFAFSADAVHYAEEEYSRQLAIREGDVTRSLAKSKYAGYVHENCTLRGCTKDKKDRLNSSDMHTTSLEAALSYYKSIDYDEYASRATYMAQRHAVNGSRHEFSMSEKDQRGGGRPIATPTLGAKVELMMIEKPESCKGRFAANNIIVPDKNKANEMCKRYKDALELGASRNMKYIFQLTEDQTKFSETDNINKYRPYILTNRSADVNVKRLQLFCLERLKDRVHLVKRMPVSIKENVEFQKWVIDDGSSHGVRSVIGWPQGMLNFLSTSVHCAADIWITKAFNIAYPDRQVITKGLVHSDDSWVSIACNNIDDFKKFALFRVKAKKMFCLKINEKKLWGSSSLGEMVSNFNLNGNVHLTVGKNLVNSFNNLNYQNWVIDVHSQISSIQQCYRGGASMPDVILLATLLKHQTVHQYKVRGDQLKYLCQMPVDLGGYPSNSVYELAVNGLSSHYYTVLKMLKHTPGSEPSKIVKQVLTWSLNKSISQPGSLSGTFYTKLNELSANMKKLEDANAKNLHEMLDDMYIKDEDFDKIVLPSKSNVFSCIHHIMPKPRKVAITLNTIRNLPFKDNGLGTIIMKAKSLVESLGHLVGRATSRSYELAADKYTQNTQRLAVNQAIQSSRKVVKVWGYPAMTYNELYLIALQTDDYEHSLVNVSLDEAFNDGSDLVVVASNIVHNSDITISGMDKRKVISKMPNIDTKYRTVCKLQDVLLRCIDKKNKHMTKYYHDYSTSTMPLEIIDEDADNILRRFTIIYDYYGPIEAAAIIMRESMNMTRSRLWTQPHLRSDTIITFLEDLYGRTLNSKVNYNIKIRDHNYKHKTADAELVHSVYNICILNSLYDNRFTIHSIGDKPPAEKLKEVDYHQLTVNDQLKLGVAKSIMLNDNTTLNSVICKLEYKQHWIRPQRRINGTYQGDFNISIKCGKLVMNITLIDEVMSMTVNDPDIASILKAMHKFISVNFKWESYNSKCNWGMCKFWQDRLNNIDFPLNLTWYGLNSTCLVSTPTSGSISVCIERGLRYRGPEVKTIITGYSFDKSLRVISAHQMESNGSTKAIRTANITQSLSIPMRGSITLVPDHVDGLSNQQLLEYGIMESAILKSPHNIKREDAVKILETSGSISTVPLINSCVHLMMAKSGLDYTLDDPDEEQVCHEVMDVDFICEMGVKDIVNIAEKTEPEDLTVIHEDYSEFTEPIGSISRAVNLRYMLCIALVGYVTQHMKLTFVKKLINNPNVYHWKQCIIRDDDRLTYYTESNRKKGVVGWMNEVRENITEGMYNESTNPYLMAFLTVANLSKRQVWDNMPLDVIRQKGWVEDQNPLINHLAGWWVNEARLAMFSDIPLINERDLFGVID
ncbi:MAG: RNA-dependent RNA polymerase [Drosophila North Esk phasmavirus]|nr:MAG: RNA-dependent RNA polymerase [Drosophila North Esk phasmavirus]